MATTPQLVSLQTNSLNGENRFMAHRDEDPNNPGHYLSGEKVDDRGFGGIGIAVITFDRPASGKVVTLSIDDPEGTTHFFQKTATVPNPKGGLPHVGVSASFLIPSCKAEHTVILKAKYGGKELTLPIVVYP